MSIILKENETMQDVIEKLHFASEWVCEIAPIAYWYENLNENGRIKDIHFSDEMRRMLGYKSIEEFPDELNTLMTFTHPDDVQIMLQGAIDAGTGKTDKYDVQYRIRKADGRYLWCNATGLQIKNHEGVIVGMYGAFIDISGEVELNEEEENKRRTRDVIKGFSKEYDAAFYGNITDNTYKKLANVDAVEKKVENIAAADVAMRSYVANFVHPDDAALFEGEFIDLKVAEKNVPVGEAKTFEYRSRSGGDYAWYKAMLRRITNTEVLIGFKNCDDEIVSRIVSDKVIGDFASVFVVNLKNDTYRFISRNRDSGFADVRGGVYTDTIREYISRVNPYYRKYWGNFLDLDKVREMLKQNSRIEYVYPLENAEKRWRRCIVERFDTENGVPTSFVMTYFVLDDASAENCELTAKLAEQKEQLEESLTFTNYFLNTYLSAYYADLNTRAFKVYKEPVSNIGRSCIGGNDYLSALTAFFKKVVQPNDFDELIALIQPEYLKEQLSQGELSRTFHDIQSDSRRIIRMQIIRGHDENHVAFGFREVTKEYEEQQKHLLGAIPISPDILAKEDIGMWAFELNEGQPPRMYGDEAMLKLVGLDHQVPPEEMYHAWYDHIDEGSYTLVQDAVSKMIAGEHAEVQYPWHHPNGSTMIVRCGGVRNPEYAKGIRVEGTHQNVTAVLHFDDDERKALVESNARFFALEDNFESLYDVNLETGDYNVFIKGQTFYEKVSTRLVEKKEFFEDSYNNIDMVAYPEDREEFKKAINRDNIVKVLECNSHFDYYYRLLVDDKPVWFRMRVVYKENDKKNIVIGIFNAEKERETQQLQKAYDEVNEANRSNELVLSFVNGIKWSYEISADDKIISACYGDSAIESYDAEHSENPMAWVNLLHPEDKDRVLAYFMSIVKDRSGKTQADLTYRIKNNDGEYHWTKISGRVRFHGDGTRELFGISVDITEQMEKERKQQEQLQEALSMAQSASRAKTTFLNNMSHDIRTPMNAIIGFTGLAASHIDNKVQVQEYLTKIGQSSDHLLSLINDVLDMSRIESGKMNLEEKEENLPSIIHTLRDIVQADIRAKQHDFFIDTVNVNDEDIICDKLRLNQVLLNILSNAIKYTANGGIVSMRITEKAVKPSGYATYEFCIKDNGMGMDADYLKTIFDPFTRMKSSTVSGIQGTGLGMAITKNIIDMMGGQIEIQSTPGKGTQMTVTFDFRLQNAPKDTIAISELKGLRGLVVDDDADTCMSIAGMLRDIGMRDEWCVTGKEAVLRASEAYRIGDNFMVYIIDWLMPDMNGIETTRRIRKVIGNDSPIIILTAYDWSDIEEEAHEAGVTAFVSKPMFPSDLHRVLNNCLGKMEDTVPGETCGFELMGKKILLVEDNELNREIAVELLEEEGLEVEEAEDGSVAVEILKEKGADYYDFVLMDIQMPVMNGYEATKAIRAMYPDSKLPIIALSANAFAEDKAASLAAGMNDHVAKPIKIKELFAALANFM